MKITMVLYFQMALALALLAMNVKVWHPQPVLAALSRAESAEHGGPGIPSTPGPIAEQAMLAVSLEPASTSPTDVAATNSPEAEPVPAYDWSNVETTDYKRYARNLRALGFPEQLVRDMVIADVNKLYEAREAALKPKLAAYDAPLSQRDIRNVSAEDWQRIQDLWQLRIEKQGVLEEILGAYVPREILRTPISRNYDAYEYAISLLPQEKRDAVQLAQETEILTSEMHHTSMSDPAAELEAYKQSRQQRDAALQAVLTPEEFELYDMRTTPAGTELARRVAGMQPTDQEMLDMFRIAWTNWVATGGVYGRYRAVPVPAEQLAAANQEMNASLQQVLGPDRFLDYQMSVSGTGQKLRNFAARFDLPRETITQAFDLQTRIDRLSGQNHPQQLADLQAQFQQLLGPQLWDDWQTGRKLAVNLSP